MCWPDNTDILDYNTAVVREKKMFYNLPCIRINAEETFLIQELKG